MNLNYNWKLTVFSAFFVSLFLYLGYWQIERGQAKEILISEDKIRRTQTGVGLGELPTDKSQLEGLPVLLHGRFSRDNIFLLDNVVLKGKVGFEVLVLFEDLEGTSVVVNRGFVAMGRTRSDLPIIPPLVTGEGQIRGNIYVTRRQTSERQVPQDLISGEMVSREIESPPDGESPLIVQSGDPVLIGSIVGRTLYPHMIRLAELEQNALPRYWPVTLMKPVRHFSYSVTWFLMAATVVVAFMVFTLRDQRRI